MKLRDLATHLGATLEGDGDIEIVGCAPIDEAGPEYITFVANPRYAKKLPMTTAGAVIAARDMVVTGRSVLRCDDPQRAFAHALAIFDSRPRSRPGTHPTAVVDPSARIGSGAHIGAYVVIGENVTLGDDAVLHPHVTIYAAARIGRRFTAHAGVVIRECVVIGDDVVIQPGAVVGADGFGFLPRGKDLPLAVPQTGTVEVADHVEIGANTTIDRAATGKTRIGRGAKIDNLVQVAHGCAVGERTMIAAQTGLAGSARVGSEAMLGGQVGVTGHVHVGDRVQVAAQSGIAGDVEAGRVMGGSPALDLALWRRCMVALRRLPDLLRRVRVLETRAGIDADDEPS
jgi:UDP-3-O-[3-hydroxymyristoyl] glucosamine N-acyltransferase